MASETFTTTGTWTAPAGVTSVSAECWGGGGSGAGSSAGANGAGGNGASWVALPTSGVANSYTGNLARYITTLTYGLKHWRVRAFAG